MKNQTNKLLIMHYRNAIIFVLSFIVFYSILTGCKTNKEIQKTDTSSAILLRFWANKTNIDIGDEVILTWKSENLDRIYIPGMPDTLKQNGEIRFKPMNDTSINLIGSLKGKDTLKRNVTIKVIRPAITFFEIRDTVLDDESETKAFWNVSNASAVYFSGVTDTFALVDSVKFKPGLQTLFTLTATNRCGYSVQKRDSLKIIPREVVNFSRKVYIGDSAMLSWKFKNTKSVNIKGLSSNLPPEGKISVMPKKTTKYIFEVNRTDGTISTFIDSVVVKPAAISSFTGPKFSEKDAVGKLQWNTLGVEYVMISGNDKKLPPKGSMKIQPEKTTTYTLTAFAFDKSKITKNLTVKVINRALIDTVISYKQSKTGMRFDFDIIAVDKSRYPKEIKLRVVVVDTLGNFISGLAPPQGDEATCNKFFKSITETINGKNQKVTNMKVREIFEKEMKPCDYALALDYSGSMEESIPLMNKSCIKLLKKKKANDGYSLVKFDDQLFLDSPLSWNKDTLVEKFKLHQNAGGATALYAASDMAMNTLKESKNEKVLAVLTDGYENSSFSYNGKYAISAYEIVKKARASNVRINTIGVGEDLNSNVLNEIAMLTGGNYYTLLKQKQIGKMFNELSIITKHYYEITFTPVAREDKHNIVLTYNNNIIPNVSVSSGYFIGEKYTLSEYTDDPKLSRIDSLIKAVLPPGKKLSPITPPQAVAFFNFDKVDITPKSDSLLSKFVDYLNKYSGAELFIIGHTDLKGTDIYCDKLSEKRARSVKDFLVSKGVDKKLLWTAGCGRRMPVWNIEKNEVQAQENRRVEIIILK